MHDGILLETNGVPAAVVVTEPFLHMARLQRAALGMTGLEPVVITHPLSSLNDEEIAGRAKQVVEQAKKAWLGQKGCGPLS